MNKILICSILAVILLGSVGVNKSYAEGGDSVWLKKTKRGFEISCPYGYKYEETTFYSCTKKGEATLIVELSYNNLFVEEEFFNEKDIMKQAIISVKLWGDVEILEKKTALWFGKITADIKYETNDMDGLQRMVVFNDGTVITMHFATNYDIREADKMLSTHIKILEPNQVIEIEKKNAEYAKKAQERASLKQAEEQKKKLEQEKKRIEQEKKAKEEREAKIKKEKELDKLKKIKEKEIAEQKQKERKELAEQNQKPAEKKAIEVAKPIGKDQLPVVKEELSEKILFWKSKVDSLLKRYEKANKNYKFTVKGFDDLSLSIKNFERDVLTIYEGTTREQIKFMINRHESPISTKYNDIEKEIKEQEDKYKAVKSLYPS